MNNMALLLSAAGFLSMTGLMQPDVREVPVVELTIQALFIVAMLCIFIGFYIGVRVNRPRYWD